MASLSALTEDPDDPLVKGRDDEEEDEEEDRRGGDEEDDSPPPPIAVDPQGIRERAKQLTSGENSAGSYFLSADGETVYYISRDDDGAGIFSISVAGGESRNVASGSFSNIQPTKDRRTIFFGRSAGSGPPHVPLQRQARAGGVLLLGEGGSPGRVGADLRGSLARHEVPILRSQHARKGLGRHQGPLQTPLGPCRDYEEAEALADQMIGELNASHVGVAPDPACPWSREYSTRLPGIELEPDQGRYRVSHVYRDGPADKEWLDMEVGDYVLAIDGQEIRPPENYWKILNHVLNDYVTLRVADSPEWRQCQGSADPDRYVRPPEPSSIRSGWRGTVTTWSGSQAGRSPTSTSSP